MEHCIIQLLSNREHPIIFQLSGALLCLTAACKIEKITGIFNWIEESNTYISLSLTIDNGKKVCNCVGVSVNQTVIIYSEFVQIEDWTKYISRHLRGM